MKETQKENKIYLTKDYSIFKKLEQNRNTSSSHVGKLCVSIKQKNLLCDFPITVNRQYEILDGQHRLEACQQLDLPVWYKFSVEMDVEDITTINSMFKGWTLRDYLNKEIGKKNENYIKFKEFMEWANCESENVALKILTNSKYVKGNTNKGIGAGGDNSNKFKIGKFIYPVDDSKSKKYVLQLKKLSQFTTKKFPYDRSLVSALDLISKTKDFDFERLISKLQNYPIGVYNDYATLIDNLEKAYNYNVQNEKKTFLNKAA